MSGDNILYSENKEFPIGLSEKPSSTGHEKFLAKNVLFILEDLKSSKSRESLIWPTLSYCYIKKWFPNNFTLLTPRLSEWTQESNLVWVIL